MSDDGSAGIDARVGCSSISLRALPLERALELIARSGFGETELGAIPGVCDHVPAPLAREAVPALADVVARSGLGIQSVNADVGDLDRPDLTTDDLAARLQGLLELAAAVDAPVLVLPCGSALRPDAPPDDEDGAVGRVADALVAAAGLAADVGRRILVEAPHSRRLCADLTRAGRLVDLLADTPVGVVLDVSHVVAAGDDTLAAADRLGDRVGHVHLRDAVPGDIHRSIGRGEVDFAGVLGRLETAGYRGRYSLELETHDVADDRRPAEASRAGHEITRLLSTLPRRSV